MTTPRLWAAFLFVVLSVGLVHVVIANRSTVLFEGDSEFGIVRVAERGDGLRTLYIGEGGARQSAIYPGRPMELALEYTRVGAIGLALAPPEGRILFVGLGGGAMPMYARQVLPDAHIDVVEINPLVVEVAHRWFGFVSDEQMVVHTEDGRAFIEAAAPGRWDLIVLDAFSDTEIPLALATREFLEAVRSRLSPEGIVMSNLHTSNDAYPSMVATYDAVFEQVRLVGVQRRRQQMLLAASAEVPLGGDDLIRSSGALATRAELGFDLSRLVRMGFVGAPSTSSTDAPLLEDRMIGARPR